MGTGVPLFYHKGSSKSSGLGDISEEDPVEEIKRHRVRDGKVEFKVRWKGATNQEDTWEPIGTFIKELSPPFLQYVQENGLKNCLLDLDPQSEMGKGQSGCMLGSLPPLKKNPSQ